MKVKRIDHVAIASVLPGEARTFFEEILGLTFDGEERVEREGVNTHFYQVGESNIEILEALGEDTPVGRFLKKRGPGLHHVALTVEGLDEMVAAMKTAGIDLLSDDPVIGAHGKRIIFIHPRSAGGVLLELTEEPI